MGSVNIDSEDSLSIKEFEDGNSIQIRVMAFAFRDNSVHKG